MVKKRLLSIITILVLLITFIPVAAFAQETVTLNAISSTAPGDSVSISGTTTLGEVTIKVIRPNNIILYVDVATAANGTYTNTFKLPVDAVTGEYTVVVGQGNVVATGTFTVQSGSLSSNANLSNLTLSTGTLNPTFSASTPSYTASVGNAVSSITVKPTATDANATIKVNGTPVISGQASGPINLSVGDNSITVVVTAQDGTTKKTYTIAVKRAAAATVDVNNPTVTITNEPTTITVPAGVTGAKIQVTPTIVGSNKEVTLPFVEVNAATSLGTIQVSIPDGTKITAPLDWEGTIKLPAVLANTSVSVSNGTVSAVVEVGFAGGMLIFDKAVRLLIPGQAGKSAGYAVGNNSITNITRILSADSQAVADSELPASGEGKIDVGSDLVIWTKHFTKFIAYTPTQGGGGGGGGGGSSTTTAVTSTTGSASVPPSAGGKIGLGSDAVIEIPANALQGTSNVQVKVEKVADPPAAPSGLKAVSGVFEFSVDGKRTYSFSKNVTLTLAFNKLETGADEIPAVYYYDEVSSKWVKIGGTVDESTITVQVDHLTKFAVFVTEKAGALVLNDIAGHWAEDNINRLVALGAISGYPDGTFRPDNKITRAEFATVLVKALKLSPQSGKVFNDTAGHWAGDFIATAAANGIVNGYSDTQFGPDDNITREQMAVMIVKAAQLSVVSGGKNFADKDRISAWAKDAVATASENNIITGYSDNTFRPGDSATRAEAVTVIVRLLK